MGELLLLILVVAVIDGAFARYEQWKIRRKLNG